jgi:acyl-CoA dehydrogenase family protein 9
MIPSRTLTKVHPRLESLAANFSSMLSDFSIKVENVLMKYGKKIIGNEMPQFRLANMAIELYVQLAVLSRTSDILNDKNVTESDKEYVYSLTCLILRDSRQSFVRNYKRISGSFDSIIPKASQSVCDRDGYGLDILKY